jgi:predicted ATPase/predicted negative regulator of RcsB-dependent stress response
MAAPGSAERRTNVRDVGSSFVGRAADIAGVARLFAEGARLSTITGPGGMGKTRVAIRYAETQVGPCSAHGGGAWFCDLTEARSAGDIVAKVAAVLGADLRAQAGEAAPVEQMGHVLARRGRLFVVLDNFEHLVPEAAVVGAWLRLAPEARFLCTSRVALDLPEEALWPLDALPRDEALELFLARARRVRPGLEITAGDREALLEIVEQLDGIPLALELGASRMAVLSPPELRDRLRRPLDLLVRRHDGTRHASMRRAILDSVQLLGPAEREAFAASAVFRGSFGLQAAEAVLGGPSVLGRVEALVHGSLLRTVSPAGRGGEMRFSLFETIREIAGELLAESPRRGEIERRHTAFYAGLAGRLGTAAAVRSGAALEQLGREQENMVEAHGRATEEGDAAAAITLALGLDPLLSVHGQARLRVRLLDEAIALARSGARSLSAGTLAEAILARALGRRELGEVDAARGDLDAGLSLAEAAGQPELAALAHLRIGEIVEVAGATGEARERFTRALSVLERAPSGPARTALEAETYLRTGHAYRREGALDQAEAAVGEATARYRLLGHDEGLAGVLYEGAVVAMFQGRAEIALARYDEGLAIAGRASARTLGAMLTTARGCLLQELGRAEEARAHHAEAARVFHELGSRYREMSATYYLATAYLDAGAPVEAEPILSRALDRGRGVGAPRYEALIEGARAITLARLGDRAAAEAALASAERALGACGSELALGATIAVHRLTLSLGEGRGLRADDAEAKARAIVAAHPSDDSRFALRMLIGALRPTPPGAAHALVVLPGGHGFRLPRAAAPVSLSRRAPLRGILELLSRRRRDAPGEAVQVDDLIRAGWPGEKIRAEAALNRLYVALTTLRKLGLRDLLVTADGGYLLDPAVPVLVAEEQERLHWA